MQQVVTHSSSYKLKVEFISNKRHPGSFHYTQDFYRYSLTWSGMTSRSWWLMLANVCKDRCALTGINEYVHSLYDSFSTCAPTLHFSKAQVDMVMS